MMRTLVIAVMLFIASAAAAAERYQYWHEIGYAFAVYELPLADLERQILTHIQDLSGLRAGNTPTAFVEDPSYDGSESVLKAPKGMTVKSVMLRWTPERDRLSEEVEKAWRSDLAKQSTVFLQIGTALGNPQRSFLIIHRSWMLKGRAHVPRTNIPLPFSMAYEWPQLLVSDEDFLRHFDAKLIVPAGHLYDSRLMDALLAKK